MIHERKIRVLVAEPVAASRAALQAVLKADPGMVVVGVATTGFEILEMTRRLNPDLVLLKMRPGGLDGVKAVRRIMESTPVPIVLMISDARATEVAGTLDALSAGALAVVRVPGSPESPGFSADAQRMISTLRSLAAVRVIRRSFQPDVPGVETSRPTGAVAARIVAIVASTGGPAALRTILSGLAASFPAPILVVQHIAEGFAEGLVAWLDAASSLCVRLADPGHRVIAGEVYVAPDHLHLGISGEGRIVLSDAPAVGGFKPSGSYLFESAAGAYGAAVLGVILTGMGEDGTEGLRALKSAGGAVLAQDEASCLVFGMPGAAIAAGLVDEVAPLDDLAGRIVRRVEHG